jgi:hypothetical protein
MQAIQIISQDLFDKIRSRFSNLEMGDETGAVTIDPVDARFFDFDFVLEGNNLGRVSISLNDLGSLKVYYSQGITENQDDPTKQLWYKFLKEMRFFAMRRLLRFDTRDISKTNLDKNDFQHLATTQPPKEETDMNENKKTKNNRQAGTINENEGLDKFRQRVQSQGFTDSPEERNADRLERKRRHNEKLDKMHADFMGRSNADGTNIGQNRWDREADHASQQRMNRDEYDTQRRKDDDEDTRQTMNMMRDRLNRMQYRNQRDVDPEQLAAISNIKYDPRKKTEGSGQAKTNDKLLAYYAQLKAEKEKQKQQGVAASDNKMNESRWTNKSSRKTSRAVQGKTEVIVRHAHPVDEEYAGSRSQKKNIKAIFIQNADGERFKYPFIHTAGAFAMAQHVDHGGVPHDAAGKAIIKMSEQIAQLGEFQRKIHAATLHDDATGITERAIGRMHELKSTIAALGKRHHYESWMSEFSEMESGNDIMELDDVTMEEYKQKFTQTNFQEELASYFPLLHNIMRETNAVDLEDYVAEKSVVEGSHEDDVARLSAHNEKMAGENPPIELGLREVGNWAKVGHYGDPIKTAWLNIAKYGIRNNRFNNSVEKTMDFISNIPDMDPEELYDIYNLDESDANNLYHSYETVYDQWDASQSIGEDTALQRLRGNPRFAQNLPAKDDDNEDPPFEPDEKSNFRKPNNPNRTGMDSARALAQRGMSPAESINAFEEWAEAVEQGKLTDDQIQELKTAIEQLPMGAEGPELELGPEGQTAIQFFQGLGLDDSELEEKLKDMANVDASTDALQVLKLWADESYPELSVALGISGDSEEPAAPEAPPEAAPAEEPTAENDEMAMNKGTMEGGNKKSEMIKLIAERVKSFYNASNESVGPFRSPENVALDVKKECAEKYGDQAGEQAYQLAETFIDKLTQQWHQKHGQVDHGDGFSIDRLKELVGNIKSKVESIKEKDDWHPSKHVTDPQKKKELEPHDKDVNRGSYADRAAYLDAAGVKRDQEQHEDGPKPSEIPAWKRKEQGKAPLTTQDLEKERDQSRTTKAGLDAHKAKLGMSEELADLMRLVNHKK